MPLLRVAAAAVASVALAIPTVGVLDSSAGTKPAHHITAKVVKLGPQDLQMRAHVDNYRNAATFLQKKTCKSCTWHKIAFKKTSQYGRVFYPIGAPRTGRWYFRVGTPERPKFRESYGPTYYTYTA